MEPRTIARAIAVGRLGFGAVLVAAPAVIARPWVGADGDTPGAQTLAMAVGARDIALGAGVLSALANGGARPWLVGSAAADLTDLVATLRSARSLPASSVALLVTIAGGSAAVGGWLVTQDDW
jgi:hypothetical protein